MENEKIKNHRPSARERSEEQAKELHKPVRHNFPRRKVMVKGIDDLWVMDLADMTDMRIDQGYRYILVVMDVLTRYAWAEPLKTKDTPGVAEALNKIIKESGRKPRALWSDIGPEFTFHVSAIAGKRTRAQADKINKEVLDPFRAQFENIYTTTSKYRKVWLIERLNRTLKNIMWYKFTRAQLRGKASVNAWVKRLPKIMNTYNTTPHRGLCVPKKYFVGDVEDWEKNKKLTPELASDLDMEDYELQVLQSQVNMIAKKKPKFKVGDHVRAKIPREHFTRGFEIGWSPEVYVIDSVNDTRPITYHISPRDKDWQADTSRAQPSDSRSSKTPDMCFYEEELQKTKFTSDAVGVKKYQPAKRVRTVAAVREKAKKAEEKAEEMKHVKPKARLPPMTDEEKRARKAKMARERRQKKKDYEDDEDDDD
jgi:hypothetical protein